MAPGRSQPPEGCCRSPPGSAALSGRLGCVAAAAQRLQVRRVQATLRRDPDRHDVVNLDRNLNHLVLKAGNAQRTVGQVALTETTPRGIITA